jgi:hypothetical protein
VPRLIPQTGPSAANLWGAAVNVKHWCICRQLMVAANGGELARAGA